jgi:hypothetical protein
MRTRSSPSTTTSASNWLVALDSDFVSANDFPDYVLGSRSVRGKPVYNGRRLSLASWAQVFEYFGPSLPTARHLTTFHLEETISTYFNAGLLILPREHVSRLRNA